MGTYLGKQRFNEQNNVQPRSQGPFLIGTRLKNGCASAFNFLVQFFAVLCKTATWNHQILRCPENMKLSWYWQTKKNDFGQEIIKIREWIPHIGPLTKVILLKLFLDIVPSSSEEATRAMLGQQVEARGNGGNAFYMFRFRFRTQMFSELSTVFLVGQAFVCFALILMYSLCGFRKFNEANFERQRQRVQWLC